MRTGVYAKPRIQLPVFALSIHLGVEVAVIEHHSIRTCEAKTQLV